MIEIALAIIGTLNALVTVAAFTYMGRSHAHERQFLINTALSHSTYEFAVRQSASAPVQPPQAEQHLDVSDFPEGLYG